MSPETLGSYLKAFAEKLGNLKKSMRKIVREVLDSQTLGGVTAFPRIFYHPGISKEENIKDSKLDDDA